MATLRQEIDALLDRLEPTVAAAFREAIDDIKSNIVLREVVERLERRDIEGAVEALNIEGAAFRQLDEAIRQAYNAGGSLAAEWMPRLTDPMGNRVVFRWDARNQAAEAQLRDISSRLITGVVEDTRTAVREAMVEGYAQGQGPRTIALDIVGRQNRITGKREGGFIGLNGPQTALIIRTRDNLLSGDPARMRKYLELKTRDKRLDGAVRRAIETGKPMDAQTLEKLLARLRDRNLRLRGETIARTETFMSVAAARDTAYRQALAKANRDESFVKRIWRSAGDGRVRHTHMALNANEVKGMDLPFQSPSGALLRYPGDTSLGAGPAEIINCRCSIEYNFDFAEAYARSRGR